MDYAIIAPEGRRVVSILQFPTGETLPEQQYKIDDTAKIMGMHPTTVRRLIRIGELEAVGRGKLRRVTLRAIRDYQQRNRSA
jgi:excisionase family DNA binding protein